MEKVNKKCYSGSVDVISVPGDGNCFFHSVIQQMTGWTTFDTKFRNKSAELRKAVVQHLQNHKERMRDVLLGEIATLMEYNNYGTDEEKIIKFLPDLEKEGTWAGTESILAVKDLLGVNILVFNPRYASLRYTHGNGEGRTVQLYFNGINHYDSVWNNNVVHLANDKRNTKEQNLSINADRITGFEECEKIKVLNKIYWITVEDKRLKVRRIVEGKDSYLWAVSHQLSGINPGAKEFSELPEALKTDLLKLQGNEETQIMKPTREIWKKIADTWQKTVNIFEQNGLGGVFESKENRAGHGEINLLQMNLNGESQIDSVEMVIQKQKGHNTEKSAVEGRAENSSKRDHMVSHS